MPRTARAAQGGYCYHVINRGNCRAEIFHGADDYAAFYYLMRKARSKVPRRVLGYILMPNHFHFVLWPAQDTDLASWMHWLLTTHVAPLQSAYHVTGRVWQGRFVPFPSRKTNILSRFSVMWNGTPCELNW